jgi:hypothetical protein
VRQAPRCRDETGKFPDGFRHGTAASVRVSLSVKPASGSSGMCASSIGSRKTDPAQIQLNSGEYANEGLAQALESIRFCDGLHVNWLC